VWTVNATKLISHRGGPTPPHQTPQGQAGRRAQPGATRYLLQRTLDDDGELIFKHACRMGLEGTVSNGRDFAGSQARAHRQKIMEP
jgi:hypothetical protein